MSVSEGDVLLLYTGTYDRYHDTAEYLSQYPGLDEAGSGWIFEKGIKALGVDSPSPDNPSAARTPAT